jgi:predicted transcriptional regulator
VSAAPVETGAATRKLVKEQYENIPRRVLQDSRISLRALGVLVLLLSMPEGWRTSATKIAGSRKEGRDAIETALKELVAVGYLARHRVQYKNGTWGWVWLYGVDPEYVAQEAEAELERLRFSAA